MFASSPNLLGKSLRLLLAAVSVAVVGAGAATGAWAAWPDASRPVRIVVGFPAGGGADVLARAISPDLSQAVGAPVVVENKPGAGGLLATEYVAKSSPDGYVLYIATPGSFTIWPSLRHLNYDAAKDFAPISTLVTMPNLLVTGAGAPYKDVTSLIDAAKQAPSGIDYGSGGVGTIGQIAAEQFASMAGVRMNHVPYKGTAPLLTDVIGGVIPVTFSDPSARTLAESGKLRILAVTTAKRSALFPNVPTLAEAGVPGYDLMNWYGLVAPAETPVDVVNKLNAALTYIMAKPDIQARLAGAGMEATSSTPAKFGQLMARERAKWAALIAKVGIKAQ